MEINLEYIAHLIKNLDEKMDKRFDEVDKRFDQNESRMDRLDAEVARHEVLLQQLIEMTAGNNVKINELNVRIDKVEARLENIEKDVREINENMATKKDLEYYDQMISEHSREIYKLKK